MRLIIFIILTLISTNAIADTLTTENYVVVIKRNCPEGHITCNNVTYTGLSKKSGKTIRLRGQTWHTTCADGVTPCRFRGYEFKNRNYTYLVHQDGLLQVIKGRSHVILEEYGNWSD